MPGYLPTALPFSPNTARDGRKWRFQEANLGPANPSHTCLSNSSCASLRTITRLAKLVPTSEPLHMLFSLPGASFLQLLAWLAPFHPSSIRTNVTSQTSLTDPSLYGTPPVTTHITVPCFSSQHYQSPLIRAASSPSPPTLYSRRATTGSVLSSVSSELTTILGTEQTPYKYLLNNLYF